MSNSFLDTDYIEKWKKYDISQNFLMPAINENKESETESKYDFVKLIRIGTDFDESCYWHKHPM